MRFLLAFLAIVLIALPAGARGLSDMYTQEELRQSLARVGENLRGVWSEDLFNALTRDEKRTHLQTTLELPLVGQAGGPIEFYAFPGERRVVIPIFGVKFLNDFTIAMAWLERHSCDRQAMIDYAAMLRYGKREAMPNERFPPPLEALGIPDNALDDAYVDDVSLKALKSAIYFVMAHELAHVHLGHKGYGEIDRAEAQAQERAADAFALEVMRRIRTPPYGMVPFFMLASALSPSPLEFASDADYLAHVENEATHPVSSERLQALADRLEARAGDFVGLDQDPAIWRPRIVGVARSIGTIAGTLGDIGALSYIADRGRKAAPSALARACVSR